MVAVPLLSASDSCACYWLAADRAGWHCCVAASKTPAAAAAAGRLSWASCLSSQKAQEGGGGGLCLPRLEQLQCQTAAAAGWLWWLRRD
jgi:hypothetical protein